jgi:hypothetical protein
LRAFVGVGDGHGERLADSVDGVAASVADFADRAADPIPAGIMVWQQQAQLRRGPERAAVGDAAVARERRRILL